MAETSENKQELEVQSPAALDSEAAWTTPAYSPPDDTDIEQVQKQINEICGVTRDSRPIALLAWNGDRRYWKDVCIKWSPAGEPLEFIKRPIVLYKAVYGPHRRHIIDLFPPRWLLLTRIEPEQYVPTWERDSQVYDPSLDRYIRIRPAAPPAEMYVWYATIARHTFDCCARAERERRICYGRYVPAAAILESLYGLQQSINKAGLKDAPFDRPDRATIKLREQMTSGYVEQALKTFEAQFSVLADAVTNRGAKQLIRGAHMYALDSLEQKLKRENL